MRIFLYLLPLTALLLLPGCAWFRDDRPEPDGSPYAVSPRQPKQTYSEAEAVNAAVSAISLRMAASSKGPFRVMPLKGKTTPAGAQVIESLIRMRLSKVGAAYPLLLEDTLTGPGEWTLILRNPDGSCFFTKTFHLKGKNHDGP